ncbi:MAG: hypothetical protein V1822_03060 [Candidatus Micrarchaeota archaeon]
MDKTQKNALAVRVEEDIALRIAEFTQKFRAAQSLAGFIDCLLDAHAYLGKALGDVDENWVEILYGERLGRLAHESVLAVCRIEYPKDNGAFIEGIVRKEHEFLSFVGQRAAIRGDSLHEFKKIQNVADLIWDRSNYLTWEKIRVTQGCNALGVFGPQCRNTRVISARFVRGKVCLN